MYSSSIYSSFFFYFVHFVNSEFCDFFQSLSGSLNSDDFDSDVFDSEDDASQRETEGGDDKDSSEDELELHGNCLF